MIRTKLIVFGRSDLCLLLRTEQKLHIGLLDIIHTNQRLSALCGQKSRFVHEVCELCARKTNGGLRDLAKINSFLQGLITAMHAKNFFSTAHIGIIYSHTAVKTTGTKQCGVKDIGAVRCRHDNYTGVRSKSVHLHQKLVQRLLTLIVTAAKACASVSTNGINFIDENNTCRRFSCVIKKITHTGSSDAHIHLHKIRSGNREERNTSFAGNSLCKKCFTRTGRAYKKNTSRNSCAKLHKFRWILQEFYNFFKLCLLFFTTRNINEFNRVFLIYANFCFGF